MERIYPAALAALAALATPTTAQSVVLGRQSFEGNTRAVESIPDQGSVPAGTLTVRQQALELVDTSEFAPNGNVIREFVQPPVTHDPTTGLDNLPFLATGRVFDSGIGLPWRLKWFNSRVTQGVIDEAARITEAQREAFLASLGFPTDLVYIPQITADQHVGPVVVPEFDVAGGILNQTANTFVGFSDGTLNGVTPETADAFGVGDVTLLEGFDGQSGPIPDGSQALFVIDSDGTTILEFDPVDASAFGSLRLSFSAAAGRNSNTSYDDFDRFEVRVNGQPVFGPLLGQSGINQDDSPRDELDAFANGGFQDVQVDISQFAGVGSVVVSFLFDNNSQGNTFDAFSLDDFVIEGVPGAAPLVGDFNGDDSVNAADYTVWRDALGASVTPGTGADASRNGFVDTADRELWAQNFGRSRGSLSAAVSVPEPSGMLVVGALAAAIAPLRRRD